MQTVNNGGDVLARGGVRAQFGPPNVSQEKWDAIWAEEPKASAPADESAPEVQEPSK